MRRGSRGVQDRLAVVLVLEGLGDEGGTEAQATTLAEGLVSLGHETLFASRWPIDAAGERVARVRAAGVDVVTPKWVGSRTAHMGLSSYNIRRSLRAGQLAVRRRVVPTARALATDEQALRARDHDTKVILLRKVRRWALARRPLPTVVHVLARHTAVLIPDLKRLGLPLVYSELGQPSYYTDEGSRWQTLDVDAMTADSVEAAQLLEARGRRRVQVIPSTGGFAAPTTLPSLRARRFVMVNRLHPAKRVEVAIQATAAAGPRFSLEVLGSGPSTGELETLARSLGVLDRVSFRGAVNRERVRASLDAADAFILTSSTEGTPTSVIEAMSRGRCVVAAPVGGVPDLLRHEREGLFFDGSVLELSMAMRRLDEESGLARELGSAARIRWLTSLSPETIVKRYVDVYRGVLVDQAVGANGKPR